MMKPEYLHSVCPHDCPSTCALEVERLTRDRIGKVRGARDNDFTNGTICAKVARYADRVHHPDRLTTPLRRTGPKGSGQFEPTDWETALDLVAGAFADATAQHGAESVWPYHYAGTMGLVQRDGIDRLTHVMGYSRQHSTICSSAVAAGIKAGFGATRGTDPREMEQSDLIVLWGVNAAATQVHVIDRARRARKTRGTVIVSIDPYRNRTAELADHHLALRPGTDGALACAVMHVLFRDGHADRDFLTSLTDFPEDLEAHLATRTPVWAAGITGLPVDQIEQFATLYGETPNSYIRLGFGMSRTRNGSSSTHAVSCLPAVTGAWRHRGGGLLQSNSGLYPVDSSLIEGLDRLDPSVRKLDMSRIGTILTGNPDDLQGGPAVHAMLIQNTNPAVVAPHSGLVREGLLREDLFVCVHEQFMTETARYADVVLPATTFLEHEDLYRGSGHTYLQVARAVIDPPAECRNNHQLLQGLAERLGAEHPGFDMTVWELIDATLQASGLPGADQMHAAHWHDCALPFEAAHYLEGFAHPDGRFRFAPDWSALGSLGDAMPKLPDHYDIIDAPDRDHPFRLITAPAHHFLNTSFTETENSRKREGRPTAMLHSEDGALLGVADGARVRIGNRQGSLLVHARLFDGLQRGVVVVESVWPNAAFEEGIGINLLVSDDPIPPVGGAVFHDTAVWLQPAL